MSRGEDVAMVDAKGSGVAYCSDGKLGYERSRTRFDLGAGLALDETYRLAHLPLIAPDHPRVIADREGTFYAQGRHPRVDSLVLPISWAALQASDAYRRLDRELRMSAFGHKIAWDLIERRRDRLHATLCGSLAVAQDAPPLISQEQRAELARLGPMHVELRGLFSGNVNVGRLYLRVYPERRGGRNLFQRVQQILGRPKTDLYVVGIYNLTDDLDSREACALAAVLERWWHEPILRIEVDRLWLLWAMDDLVLDGGVSDEVWLTRRPASAPEACFPTWVR